MIEMNEVEMCIQSMPIYKNLILKSYTHKYVRATKNNGNVIFDDEKNLNEKLQFYSIEKFFCLKGKVLIYSVVKNA